MTRRSLRFEQLERRELLAGDVKVALVRGDLIVTGDSNKTAGVDEAIAISYQAEDSTYRVTGVNGTRVDGLESKVVSGVTRNIVVDLKTGTDSVSILSPTAFPVPGDLTLKGGSGIDFISVKNANIVGKLNIDGGSDANTVVVQSSIVGKDASIKGLAGVDTVTVGTEGKVTIKGRLIVDTGAGNDTITVNGVDQDVVIARQYKDVAVKTGDGDDILTIANSTLLGKLNIDSGKGNDDVTVDRTSISKDVSISTGDGTDGVWLKDGTIGNSTLGAKLTVNTGNGNDRVGLVDTWVGSSISILTGNDNDEIGLVRVTTPASIAVNAGNGHHSKDSHIGIYGDRIGLAGVEAKDATLDGGDSGTAQTSGVSGIGVTGSRIRGNLTIKTGSAPDRVGVGDDSASNEQSEDVGLIASLRGLLVDPDDKPIDLDKAIGEVVVDGILSINTGKYSRPGPSQDDRVLIRKGSAMVFRLDTGPGNDEALISEIKPPAAVAKMQEVTIMMGNDNDKLTLALDPASENWPVKRLIDGGTVNDTLVSQLDVEPPLQLPYSAIFRNWEKFEQLPEPV